MQEAQDHIKGYLDNDGDYLQGMTNPPDFVFANVHGELQVKMQKRVKKGMFFSFSSIMQLSSVISNAQLEVPTISKNRNYANLEALVAEDWACHQDDVVAESHDGVQQW